ncbi:MAG: hypothetical protein QOG31_165, partial [Thermoplasmata archaeon]|nr:hypothetical protein [Thermoplasmata archaeon]
GKGFSFAMPSARNAPDLSGGPGEERRWQGGLGIPAIPIFQGTGILRCPRFTPISERIAGIAEIPGLPHLRPQDRRGQGWRQPFRVGRAIPRMVIRKLPRQRRWRLYSREPNPTTGRRRNLGTFDSLEAAVRHEKEVQVFKRR